MTFIFTPKEVASLRRAIHRAGRAQDDPKPGTLQHALRNVQFEDPNDGEGDDLLTTRMPPDLMDWLDSINERGKGGRWDGEFQGGNMYCMTLSDGDRYYVGMHTKVAVFRPSGIVEVKALDVEQGEVLLLPAQKDEINMSLKDAVLNAYEAKEPEHRERVEAWKESVVDKAQCLGIETAEALCAKLRGLGAIDIDVKNIDETFYSWGMIAPRNEWHLVKATTVLCPGKFNPDEVRTSINRLRGMRRMGGKFLKRYAALSYITDHDDLHARFEKDFKLTHQDILNLVRPCPVINISPPLQAPERINNFLSEAMNQ